MGEECSGEEKVSDILAVTAIFTLVLLRDVLQGFHSAEIVLGKGMLGTMVHGMEVIAVVSAISLMMSLRTYVMSRRNDYELLRVLGVPIKLQKALQLLEYVGSMIVSAVIGGLFGTGIVFALRSFLCHFSPYFKEIGIPGGGAYLTAAGICLLLFILCLIINREVAVETNLNSVKKNSFEKTKLPPDYTKWISIPGIIIVGGSGVVYLSFRDFGEGMFYIIGLFAGLLVLWIFGGGLVLSKERNCLS